MTWNEALCAYAINASIKEWSFLSASSFPRIREQYNLVYFSRQLPTSKGFI